MLSETDKIDFVTQTKNGQVKFTLTATEKWTAKTILQLDQKVRSYHAAISCGAATRKYPQIEESPTAVVLVHYEPLNDGAEAKMTELAQVLRESDIELLSEPHSFNPFKWLFGKAKVRSW